MTVRYAPPVVDTSADSYRQVIDRPFNETWDAFIQHTASSFFGIDHFEKDSGLMTLSFGHNNPSEYVDGGQWIYKKSNLYGKVVDFEGNYVDYLVLYHGGELTGKMNIVGG